MAVSLPRGQHRRPDPELSSSIRSLPPRFTSASPFDHRRAAPDRRHPRHRRPATHPPPHPTHRPRPAKARPDAAPADWESEIWLLDHNRPPCRNSPEPPSSNPGFHAGNRCSRIHLRRRGYSSQCARAARSAFPSERRSGGSSSLGRTRANTFPHWMSWLRYFAAYASSAWSRRSIQAWR